MKKAIVIVSFLLIITLALIWHLRTVESYITSTSDIKVHRGTSEQTAVMASLTKNLTINFLDVGQGDAALINFLDGEKMLVDCGPDAGILSALGRVMPYYDREIDYLVVSHPDLDHYGGCIDVLNRFKVKNIVYNGLKKPGDKAWQWFWDLVQKSGAKYFELDQETIWDISSTTIDFLYPNKPVNELIKTDLYKNYNGNNLSIVFTLNYNGQQVLFTGDAETALEKYLIDIYGSKLKSVILKVGHHGSSNSSNKDFLSAVVPQWAIISVGKNNKFDHPTMRVLKKLERTGAKILRTDESGDITCQVGEKVECN